MRIQPRLCRYQVLPLGGPKMHVWCAGFGAALNGSMASGLAWPRAHIPVAQPRIRPSLCLACTLWSTNLPGRKLRCGHPPARCVFHVGDHCGLAQLSPRWERRLFSNVIRVKSTGPLAPPPTGATPYSKEPPIAISGSWRCRKPGGRDGTRLPVFIW